MWMFPVALACGNTFVLKPSEKVPLSANLIGELLVEAGLPPGVFNIVHGDKECVDVLLTHPLLRAVSFVGSTSIAKYVYETGTKNGKRVQSAGGAKNHLIIMPDADLDQAVAALQASAFGCAGERCMAGSVAVSVGGIADEMVSRLVDKASKMKVGPTDNDPTIDMGPLISAAHRDRVAGYLDTGKSEGATVALDGRRDVPAKGFFLRPSVVDHVKPGTKLANEEIFGPVLSVVRVNSLEQALEIGRKIPVRQWRIDLHAKRLRCPPIQAILQRRNDRRKHRRPRTDGLVPLHRLEPILLRRPAHPGPRVDSVLHAGKDDHDTLVRKRFRRCPRSGLAT